LRSFSNKAPPGAEQGGVMVDTLFVEGQSGLKVVFFVIVVLVLLALAGGSAALRPADAIRASP
jgi:hypothetical protein